MSDIEYEKAVEFVKAYKKLCYKHGFRIWGNWSQGEQLGKLDGDKFDKYFESVCADYLKDF
jgi:hypothetical protein